MALVKIGKIIKVSGGTPAYEPGYTIVGNSSASKGLYITDSNGYIGLRMPSPAGVAIKDTSADYSASGAQVTTITGSGSVTIGNKTYQTLKFNGTEKTFDQYGSFGETTYEYEVIVNGWLDLMPSAIAEGTFTNDNKYPASNDSSWTTATAWNLDMSEIPGVTLGSVRAYNNYAMKYLIDHEAELLPSGWHVGFPRSDYYDASSYSAYASVVSDAITNYLPSGAQIMFYGPGSEGYPNASKPYYIATRGGGTEPSFWVGNTSDFPDYLLTGYVSTSEWSNGYVSSQYPAAPSSNECYALPTLAFTKTQIT